MCEPLYGHGDKRMAEASPSDRCGLQVLYTVGTVVETGCEQLKRGEELLA